MDKDLKTFLKTIARESLSNLDRAVATLWWYARFSSDGEQSANDLAKVLERAGYARQNVSRLKGQLQRDQRTARAGANRFRVRLDRMAGLDEQYTECANAKTIVPTDSVLPAELVAETRGYIDKVVMQINASFDCGLFDCCAVMCRRLLETLVIELYEHENRSNESRGADGNFMMFSGMLSHVEADSSVGLSRNGLKGLKDFKKLGDLSAHNRRFNARKPDVERIRDGMRVAVEELLHLAGLTS